jgi:hypothetical protein
VFLVKKIALEFFFSILLTVPSRTEQFLSICHDFWHDVFIGQDI